MKIIIKHNLIIFRKPEEWSEIYGRIIKEYGVGIGISWKCKRELGFTVRRHKGLAPNEADENGWLEDEFKHRYHYEEQVHLDFYSEPAQSYFMLKYL